MDETLERKGDPDKLNFTEINSMISTKLIQAWGKVLSSKKKSMQLKTDAYFESVWCGK